MTIDERLERLENAHRALSAKHTGLVAVCRVMLPLIDTAPALAHRLLTSAYDIYSTHMVAANQDDEYQATVRREIDLLTGSILAGVDIRQKHRPSPAAPE